MKNLDIYTAASDLLNSIRRNVEVRIYNDWSSLMFWVPMNWRDFTFIHIGFEVGPNRWYEIHIAFIGLHFYSQLIRECSNEDQ